MLTFETTAVGQQPELMYPIGHNGLITSADFSPDDRKIATASADKTAKIWDSQTGNLLINLEGHTSIINDVSFSADGKKIVTASGDKTAKIWDAITGKLLVDIKGHVFGIISARFSPDGKKIVTASSDFTVKIWNAFTGKFIRELTGHTGWVYSAAFSPDSKRIVTSSSDKTTKIWDAYTGRFLADLKQDGAVASAKYTSDGKHILTISNDGTAKVWDASRLEILKNLHYDKNNMIAGVMAKKADRIAVFSDDGKRFMTLSGNVIKVIDTYTGKLITAIDKAEDSIYSIKFSSSGKWIIKTGETSASILNPFTMQLIASLKGHTHAISSVVYSPEGGSMITTGAITQLWNVLTGKLIANINTNVIAEVAYSPDGKIIMTSSLSDDKKINLWDARNGQLITSIRNMSFGLAGKNAIFFPDAKSIITCLDSSIKIWNTLTGQLLMNFNSGYLPNANISPDGKTIITTCVEDSTIKIWSAITGDLLNILHLKNRPTGVGQIIFSPNSKLMIICFYNNTATLWNIAAHENIADLRISQIGNPIIFSPDSKLIVATKADGKIDFHNTVDGKLVSELKAHEKRITSISFSLDGQKIFTSSDDNTFKIWDAFTGLVIKVIQGEKNEFFTNIDNANNRVTSVCNGELNVYNINTGAKLYKLLPVDTIDYLVHNGEEQYDGTSAARKLLHLTCGTEVIELDQLKDELWVNNLAERITNGENINAKTLRDLNICGLAPHVDILNDNGINYRFNITQGRGGIGETILFVNGIEANRYKPAELKKYGKYYQLVIERNKVKDFFLSGQENFVSIKAYTEDNLISSRGMSLRTQSDKILTVSPNLYAVMIGISNYKGEELDLQYAAKDATDISASVSNAARKFLNSADGKEHVFMYNLTTNKERILLPEKNGIKKIFEEIGKKATSNDILLIFFAGHGVMAGTADKKQFYFLTADATNLSVTDAVKDVGISTNELIEWIKPQNIKAQKRVLILDACNSGQAINDIAGKDFTVRNDDRSQQVKAIDKLNEKSGLFILSASASNQSAYEIGRYSQGLLTYALLKAIKQQPDILVDGKFLDLGRWFQSASKTVSEISSENGTRQDPGIITNTNFNIGIVDDEIRAKIILAEEKPLFAASIFVDSTGNDDGLEFTNMINQQLSDLSNPGENNIVFMSNTNSADAYSVRGSYQTTGDQLTVKVKLKQGKDTKIIFEINGKKNSLKQIANEIIKKVEEWIDKNK